MKKLQKEYCQPTHLFVGTEPELSKAVHDRLENLDFFELEPEKKYVLSDLSVIFEKTKFRLDEGQSFFFIIKKAHLLSEACANKLLKILEEPPAGYFFFLLTNNEYAIIPTIRSRCYIHRIKSNTDNMFLPEMLTYFFDKKKLSDPAGFEQFLKKEKPTESETSELINIFLQVLEKKIIVHHKSCNNKTDIEKLEQNKDYIKTSKTIDFLKEQIVMPPQPGSSMLFWKKLFMTFPK